MYVKEGREQKASSREFCGLLRFPKIYGNGRDFIMRKIECKLGQKNYKVEHFSSSSSSLLLSQPNPNGVIK
jgi:hypothetical protein